MSGAGAASLEELPLPTLVVERELVTGANAAAAELLGLPLAELVGRRWADLLVERDRERTIDRQRRRLAGEPVPEAYEVSVAAGRPVPVRMLVRLAGERQLVQLVDLRHEARRRELLGALAALGARLQLELSADAVHRRLAAGLLDLGIRSTFVSPVEGDVRIDWVEMGDDASRALLEAGLGRPVVGFRAPPTPLVHALWSESAVFVDEWPVEAAAWFRLPVAEALRGLPPPGAYDHAIGLTIGDEPAARTMLWAVGGWLLAADLPAFRLFGQQVSAALAAARSIRALEARNAELGALNRVADAAAYAPSFEAFLARAGEVVRDALGCDALVVKLVDEARADVVTVHASGAPLAEPGDRVPLADPAVALVLREGRPVARHPGDLGGAFEDAMRRAGIGTALGVPLRFRSGVIGLLVAGFAGPPRDAAGCGQPLLQAMASHFAAAVESHRLLDDLRRRVSELTLLNDVTVATGALDPVLLVDNALRRVSATLRAEVAVAYLAEGQRLVPAALQGITREQLAQAPHAERPLHVLAAESRAPVWEPGHRQEERRRGFFRDDLGVEAVVSVPLLAKERALGSLVLGRRRPEPFADAEVRLLSAVGVQLGMAVDNARLLADTQRRLADLEAVNSLALRVFTSAPGDAALLLHAACREIARALDAEAAVVLELDRDGQRLVGLAGWGSPLPPERIAVDLAHTPVAAEALRRQEPAWAADVVLAAPGGAAPAGSPPLSVLFVPLTSRAETRGLVAIADPPSRRFGEAEVALAYALASEAAMGLENAELYAAERRRVQELSRLNEENARLYEDLRRSYADLARAQEQLIQQERLAALGQLAAVVAHEVRNPLGVIFNSLGTIRRLVQPAGDAKMLLDIVGEEADRLNRIVGDLLDFARPVTPRLRPEPLDRVLDEAAAAALADAAGRVRLVRDLPAGLPPVPMDARLMRQAMLNVLANAVQSMPEGGTLTLSARPDGGAVRLEIADTGLGIPEEVRHRIFEPFFTTRPTGTGLGLAVVKRILDDHHAEVRVDSEERGGTRFVIRLPLDAGVENAPPPWSRSS